MRRHSTRWPALIFGLVFLGIIAARVLWQLDRWPESLLAAQTFGVSGAIVLIIVGAIGIIVTLVRDRSHMTEKENYEKTHDSQP